MTSTIVKNIIGIILAVGIGAGLAAVGGLESVSIQSLPLFTIAIALAYIIQWVVFIVALILKSEKFYDLVGSLTYTTITAAIVLLSPDISPRSVLLLVLIVMWATRLGTFLFNRVMKQGKDDRFDEIKTSFWRFLLTWTLQGVWVSLTAGAAWTAMTRPEQKPLGWFALAGGLIFVFGYLFELVSDVQKSQFNANPENKGKFIHTGLWAWSRHPNYFGEIVLWIGIALIALPVLRGWALVSLISPLWVIVQLTLISGIPMLEKKADDRWGGQQDYETYKRETPVLIPKPPAIGK